MQNQMKKKEMLYIDANNLYGWAMSESLLYDEIKFGKNVEIEDLLNIPDDIDSGYFGEVHLRYPDNIKEKTKQFPFSPEFKSSPQNNFIDYMNENKPNTSTQNKKLICDCSDKKTYLIQ